MALADSAVQREHDKFKARGSETTVQVSIVDGSGGQITTFGEATDVSALATSSNQTDGTQQTKIKETVPTDTTKVNGSLALTRDGDGNITQIDKLIGATTYRKTLTYASGSLSAVSSWSQV